MGAVPGRSIQSLAGMKRPSGASKFRRQCAGCGELKKEMTKEHFFPVWLIERTQTLREGIEWAGRQNIPALAATVPLCGRCNRDFGRELESPMAKIFDDIETGRGLSDREAELFVRWLWKFEGLAWIFRNPRHMYTERYTLRQRVLHPIDEIRGQLMLCLAVAEARDPEFEEGALGLDSTNVHNAIFVSGVFSRVAVLVTLAIFDEDIPAIFSKYRLLPQQETPSSNAKLFFPATSVPTCTHAIALMKGISPKLSKLHDQFGDEVRWAHAS
jgi:hypothetical protein